jgi:hypothetical protein
MPCKAKASMYQLSFSPFTKCQPSTGLNTSIGFQLRNSVFPFPSVPFPSAPTAGRMAMRLGLWPRKTKHARERESACTRWFIATAAVDFPRPAGRCRYRAVVRMTRRIPLSKVRNLEGRWITMDEWKLSLQLYH